MNTAWAGTKQQAWIWKCKYVVLNINKADMTGFYSFFSISKKLDPLSIFDKKADCAAAQSAFLSKY